ncbi:GRP family sugar transporter [Aestuariivivens sediminis]|uniref:GRP family sugar transporter n=1 Tax=Aestuariivivens sediminis TaxID=2913557 RepID=UPI001F578403|nr:GRP family sugar transporter [Aestuariivivens sediminis]
MEIVYALVAILAWGTWIAPSQNVKIKNQQTRTLYVTIAVLLLALIASIFVGFDGLNSSTMWYPFIGGLIWAVSGWSAFVGTKNLGMAKAFGIWAPMNIVVSIMWGALLFNEFSDIKFNALLLALLAFTIIVIGILLIIFSGGTTSEKTEGKSKFIGLLGAMGAGVGFATYFIPIIWGSKNSSAAFEGFNMWIGTLPLALGMFVGSLILMLISRASPKLEKTSDYFRVLSTGFLWGVGNYGALALVELIGAGKGFTIAQLCVVVNALVGVYILKEPKPNSKAAKLTLLGVIIAITGGVILMNFESIIG